MNLRRKWKQIHQDEGKINIMNPDSELSLQTRFFKIQEHKILEYLSGIQQKRLDSEPTFSLRERDVMGQ